MSNDDKILSILERIESDVSTLKSDIILLKNGQAKLEEKVDDIIESLTEVRAGNNILLDWADRTQMIVNVPLLPNVK